MVGNKSKMDKETTPLMIKRKIYDVEIPVAEKVVTLEERVKKLEETLVAIHRRAKRNLNTRSYGLSAFSQTIHKNCKQLDLYKEG